MTQHVIAQCANNDIEYFSLLDRECEEKNINFKQLDLPEENEIFFLEYMTSIQVK